MSLDINLIQTYYNNFLSQKQKYLKMKEYYDNKQDVLQNYDKKNDRSAKTSVRNYVAKFVDDETSFVAGVPFNYISKTNNVEEIANIEYNLSHWSKKHDIELTKNLGIYGEIYELYYQDSKGQFSSKILNPSNSYIIKNEFDEIELFMYVYKRNKYNPTDCDDYIDVYTRDFIYHYKNVVSKENKNFKVKDLVENEWIEVKNPTPNIFGEIPVGTGNLTKTIYDKIKSPQDDFNVINSDQINLGSDMRYFYLILSGIDPNDENNKTMVKNINKNSILFLNGDAKVDKLEKTINDTFMQNVRNNCKNDMYELVGHTNLQEKPTSNTSGEQIIARMIQLKFRCNLISATIQDIVRERIRLLFKWLKMKENKDYLYKDINVKITLNIPKDWTVMSNVISQLSNTEILSKETLRSILPLDHSSDIEKAKVDREKQEEEYIELNDIEDDEENSQIDLKNKVNEDNTNE